LGSAAAGGPARGGGSGNRFENRGDYPRVLSSVEIYRPATDSWHPVPPMKQKRQRHAAAFGPEGRMYVFGGVSVLATLRFNGVPAGDWDRVDAEHGHAAANLITRVEMYDPKTGTWTDRAPMPVGVGSMGVARGADGRIYVVGGTKSFAESYAEGFVQIYDPRTDTWELGPKLNTPRYAHAVTVDRAGRIYAIGGIGRKKGLASVEHLETAPLALLSVSGGV